ncbi:MAG: DUF4314 domain-containing protein [Anaerorhabdus sp.]|uniref:DUF4314 domain-containing protein n=1 Tax=Anaerorhabdus sp. TaxID=1872524 RepID=UPI002FCC5D0D
MDKENIERLRNKYKKGSLIQFLDETCESVPYGIRGTVNEVDQYGFIHVTWDDRTEMALKDGKDSFEKIEQRILKYTVPLTIYVLNSDFIEEEMESDILNIDIVNNAIHQTLKGDGDIGLAKYIDSAIADKIDSILPSIEEIDGEVLGVITVKISNELTEEEVEMLEQEIEGQLSDGWGEESEQVPIHQDNLELYVSFFSFDTNWRLSQINSEIENELSMSMDMMKGIE